MEPKRASVAGAATAMADLLSVRGAKRGAVDDVNPRPMKLMRLVCGICLLSDAIHVVAF